MTEVKISKKTLEHRELLNQAITGLTQIDF